MLPIPRKDRAAHFIYGACVTNVVIALIGFLMAFGLVPMSAAYAACAGLVAALAVGFGKEVVDDYQNKVDIVSGLEPSRTTSSADFAWTALGGLSASMPTFIVAII